MLVQHRSLLSLRAERDVPTWSLLKPLQSRAVRLQLPLLYTRLSIWPPLCCLAILAHILSQLISPSFTHPASCLPMHDLHNRRLMLIDLLSSFLQSSNLV